MVGVIVGILVSAAVITGGDSDGDEFIARQAWLYVANRRRGLLHQPRSREVGIE
jgi:hypothetical protein